ncbi:MAG: hypothetical protein ACI9XU_001908 [Arenicella sp.]|jgi:hypothetical protein
MKNSNFGVAAALAFIAAVVAVVLLIDALISPSNSAAKTHQELFEKIVISTYKGEQSVQEVLIAFSALVFDKIELAYAVS